MSLSLEELELLKEVHLVTMGLPESAYVTISSKSIIFKHLNVLYGSTAKITVRHLLEVFGAY